VIVVKTDLGDMHILLVAWYHHLIYYLFYLFICLFIYALNVIIIFIIRHSSYQSVPVNYSVSCSSICLRCGTDVVEGLGELLQHVSSIKALASIKSAVHALLSAPPSLPGAEDASSDLTHVNSEHAQWEERWKSVCGMIMSKEVNIWDTFFGSSLLKRVHVSGLYRSLVLFFN